MDMGSFLEGFTLLTLLGIIGASIKWVYETLKNKMDSREESYKERESKLQERQDAFEHRRDSEISLLQEQVKNLTDVYQKLHDDFSKHKTALYILVGKVMRDDPDAPELKLVGSIIGNEDLRSFSSGTYKVKDGKVIIEEGEENV